MKKLFPFESDIRATMSCHHNFFFLLGFFFSSTSFCQIPVEIEDPWVIADNKLPPRTSIWPSPTEEEASISTYDQNSRVFSLNGEWLFHWSPDPQSRPMGFQEPGFDRSGWTTIPVPSTMERQGYGTPVYVNSRYPFKVDPPRVMGEPDSTFTSFRERNPVGSFCRSFQVPEKWSKQEIILHFAGLRSAAFIWINGKEVGYTQGSRLPAEFAVSSYLQEGENFLAVEVYKYSDGSYLEDQDFWRLSGIFRDVFIRAVPKTTLWDVYARPVFDPKSGDGKVVLHYTAANFSGKKKKKGSLSLRISAPDGTFLGEHHFDLPVLDTGFTMEQVLEEIPLGKVDAWFGESPLEYRAEVAFCLNKKLVDAYSLPLGFRKIEVAGKQILFNGKPMKVRGVNRHEFSPGQGYVIDREQMLDELKLMKAGNVQFSRTAHYPNDPRWYPLCDSFGMMLMDEANVESHQLGYHTRILPGDKPEWMFACIDRARRMVIRDRQFPSVVMWSLGNEAGFGDTFLEMRKTILALDPEHRLIQYADMNLVGDVDSQTYPTIEWLKQHILGKATRKGERGEISHEHQHGSYPSGRPFIMNEYCHAMGNSLGNIKDYWDLIYKEDLLAGGFIWDWIDQSLYRDPKDPESGFIYGGYYGDVPNDRNTCVNGIIGADLLPHPHYQEMKKVYQLFSFELVDSLPFTIRVINRHLQRDASEFSFHLILLVDGKIFSEEQLPDFQLSPLNDTLLVFEGISYAEGKEVFLNIECHSLEKKPWGKSGDVLAWEQFSLNEGSIQQREPGNFGGRISLIETTESYILEGSGFKASMNKSSGMIFSLTYGGDSIFTAPVSFNFWRALTDNDRGWKVYKDLGIWKEEGDKFILEDIKVDSTGGLVRISGEYIFPQSHSKATLTHVFHPDAEIQIAFKLEIPEEAPSIPRIGLKFELEKGLEEIQWYGRGPHENYLDRLSSAPFGIYSSTVADWVSHYVRPQETANRCGVRWIEFGTGSKGVRIETLTSSGFSVSAWPWTQEVLDEASYDFELKRHDAIILNIDHSQMGLGGDNSWSHPVMYKYQLKPGTYEYGFSIKPFSCYFNEIL